MGALEAPQDKHGRGPPERNRQTGTMAELGALEAMAVQGAQEAMAVVFTAGTPSTPPQKKFPWGSQGVSGALRG